MKVSPLGLSLAVAAASAPLASSEGCYPAHVAGTDYKAGDKVSFNSTNYQCIWGYETVCKETAPTGGISAAWSNAGACSGTASVPPPPPPTAKPTPPLWEKTGCPAAYAAGTEYPDGTTVSHNGIVYKCRGFGSGSNWCGKDGYEPGVDLNWGMAWEQLGSCSGQIAPTASPTVPANAPGCPAQYDPEAEYAPGEMTAIGVMVYECKPAWPLSQYCNVYAPDNEQGGPLGWNKIGGCDGTIAPTASPVAPTASQFEGKGCPQAYAVGGDYSAGDKVEYKGRVYECKQWPYSGFCGQANYEPGTTYGNMGWNPLGWCDGTIKPTAAPTIDPNAPGCPPVYDPSVVYQSGMNVEKDNVVYKCRNYPEGGYCNAGPNFAPGSTNSAMGWIKVGSCDGTIAPTASPVHAGTDSGGCNHPYRESDLATYKAGVRVESNGFIFECVSDIHASKYCSQLAYAPGGMYWSMGWKKIGWCDGTLAPTKSPSATPSLAPSASPSAEPSLTPSSSPSLKPSAAPSDAPSLKPSAEPSLKPSAAPSDEPSLKPSAAPSDEPSLKPSAAPSDEPSLKPSAAPSDEPSLKPSVEPSSSPSESLKPTV